MNTDRLARYYRWIEYAAFGRVLERARTAHLMHLQKARRVLVLGEGDGRALKAMMAIAPEAAFDVIETSPEMIALARQRIPDQNRAAFHCRDARVGDLPFTDYDAVVTLFFLDCLTPEDLKALAAKVVAGMRPDGIWLVSDFAIPTTGWRRWYSRLWIWTMYLFFRISTGLAVSTLPPIYETLHASGMVPFACRTWRGSMIRAVAYRKIAA